MDPSANSSNISLVSEIENALADSSNARILSLMGPNGSGKTRALKGIKEALDAKKRTCFMLPANRQFGGIGQLRERHQNFGPVDADFSEIWTAIINDMCRPSVGPHEADFGPMLRTTLHSALGDLLWRLFQSESDAEQNYEKQAAAFLDGKIEERPLRKPSPIRLVEQRIGQILDYEVKFKRNPQPGRGVLAEFKRGQRELSEAGLSDGEKQILLLSVFLLSSNVGQFVFLVDEPELYLNESRAVQIWETLETHFPHGIFFYATHSPIFSTRPTVQKTYLIDMDGVVDSVDRTLPVSPSVIREMLGTRVQLLRTNNRTIFCEDDLSRLIIDDLFVGSNITSIPAGNCNSVIAAVTREPGWQAIRSASPKFCGVIDRDTRDDVEIQNFASKGVFCFPLYEAESFLLAPEIIEWMPMPQRITGVQYQEILLECATEMLGATLKNVAVHLSERQTQTLKFKVGFNAVESVALLDNEPLEHAFKAHAARLYAAIKDKNTNSILQLFKGKLLYQAARKHFLKRGFTLPEDPKQRYLELRLFDGFKQEITELAWLSRFKGTINTYLETD
jgi:ABC-type cobalamin/Fe3+-siderophores transport system ATPase subunit